MYIVKATRTTKQGVADAYVKGVNRRVEYVMHPNTEDLWLVASTPTLTTNINNTLNQTQLKKLFELLPKDELSTRTTGGGIRLEYTKEV